MPASILFVNRAYPPDEGATGRLAADLAHWLAGAGWRPTVLATGPADGPARTQRREGPVLVVRAAAPGGRSLRATVSQLRALARAAAALPPADLTVTMTDPPLLALFGPRLARRGTVPIHWCHDLYPDLLEPLGLCLPGPLRALIAGSAGRAMAAHRGLVAIGRAMAERLAERNALPAQFAVIPNWADPAIRPDQPSAAGLRRAYGFEGRVAATYSGNLGRLYDFATLIEAAAQLEHRRPDLLIALAGSGAREQAIRAEAARRGLANLRILPPQPRDRLGAWLAASDLHLALMPEAALGRMEPCKVAGILAAGRPCLFVGPAQSDMARLVAGSGAGRVVPPGDAAALAAAIADLVDRPRLRAAMAANALAASGACRLDKAAPRFEAFASAVLASARQRNSGAAARPSPAAAHLADLPARAGNANG